MKEIMKEIIKVDIEWVNCIPYCFKKLEFLTRNL